MTRSSGGKITGILLVAALIAVGAVFYLAARSPKTPLLVARQGARWIRLDEPSLLVVRSPGLQRAGFSKTFRVDVPVEKAGLTIYAFKDAAIFLDNVPVLDASGDMDAWTTPRQVELGGRLGVGVHELKIIAANRNAPMAVLAYSDELGIRTGPDWQASPDGVYWSPATDVEDAKPVAMSYKFQRADKALLSIAAYLTPVFLVVFIWTLGVYCWKSPVRWFTRLTPSASMVRWGVIGLWVVLAINDIIKVPVYFGFDSAAHVDYIDYVATNWRIPLAPEGWQMFQSPLYYLLSAPFFLVFKKFLPEESAMMALRFITLACGVFQAQLSYMAAKYIWPERDDMRALATVIGGLLPVNIYMSQYLGNEPLAGVLSAAAIVWAFKVHITPVEEQRLKDLVVLGAFMGLALLTKATAILLVMPVMLMLIYRAFNAEAPFKRLAPSVLAVFGAAFVVCGWYYIRNWVLLGTPFVAGWNAAVWWQDPGLRTPAQFLSFGQSLLYPVFSSVNGIWDSLYSTLWTDASLGSMVTMEKIPPWNYSFMLGGALLAIIPTAGIIAGVMGALGSASKGMKNGILFAVVFAAAYVAAIAALFLTLPIYSTAKASYVMGVVPCIAVLAAFGLSFVMRNAVMRAIVYGGVACWAVSSYIAYFAF